MQNRLPNVIGDFDRLEIESLNENDGGEECEAILTAFRRAKRRAARRKVNLLEGAVEKMVTEKEDEIEVKPEEPLEAGLNGATSGREAPILQAGIV
jgi:hypothetical protein